MNFKDYDVEVKEYGEDDGGYIVAYASTFHRDPDAYGDIVRKGAFANSLKKWEEAGKPIPLLFGHRTDDPTMNIGAVVKAEEDDTGLLVKATFDPDSETAQYCRKLVKEGRLYKLSFAYDTLDHRYVTLEDGTKANELLELDIFEVSLVPIPANQHAQVVDVKDGEAEEKDAVVVQVNPSRIFLTDDQGNVLKELDLSAYITPSDDQPGDGSEVISEETPEQPEEGDSSETAAADSGEKGAPEVDWATLARFYQTI